MTSPANSAVQNLLPVQAYFDAQNNFVTFIGQGEPFYATVDPSQSGLNITNSIINSTTIGLTVPAAGAFTSFSTNTGTIATQPTGATDIVNLLALQSYAAGISWKQPCAVATLTNITLSGLQLIDGYTTLDGDRVLVKNQGTAADNGIYIASAGPWVRSFDANAWQEFVSAISFIESGGQAGSAWFCTAVPGGTLGVTPLNWSQFTTSATYLAGTGLTLTGFTFSITNTGVPASTYGSATATPVFAVNAQGQITSVTNTTITPAIGNVTGLGANVATFLATPTSANLAAAVSDETGSGALVFATSPTLVTPALGTPASGIMTNVTGLPLTTGVTGTLPIANGGTGQITASAAFNALSPITTIGDMIYGSAANTSSRLGIGTDGQVLTVVAGIPAWVSVGANVSSFSGGTTGLTPATATTGAVTLAGTLNIANGGTGITVFGTGVQTALGQAVTGSGGIALATSPVFTTPNLGTPSAATLTNATGLPVATGISGLGTGVATALAVAVGSVGAFVTNGGALGTPSSGVATNLTGTAAGLSIGGNAATATTATTATNATNTTNVGITDDTTTNATVYPAWVTTTTGNLPVKTASSKLTFNPSTGTLSATTFNGAWSGMPSGTAVIFQQTAAPTGWTKVTTYNDYALRVVSGSAGTGGTVAFTTAFASQAVSGTVGNTTITTTTMASHSHTYSGGPFGTPFPSGGLDSGGGGAAFAGFTINNTGGDGAHNHSFSGTAINLAVQYVDTIIATKN